MQDRPESNINNIWYEYNDSDTVFVFIHGIFSDSRDAWYYEDKNDPSKNKYWPELVKNDENFGKVSIFLGGYYTKISSGSYNFRDAANELYQSLSIGKEPAKRPLLNKKNIIFIAHSSGGIVIRHILVRHADDFHEKNVGLVLIASPSMGTEDARRLKLISKIIKHKMGEQLAWDGQFLEDLDKDFKNLIDERKIKNLAGVEAIENHFIIRSFRLFSKKVIVTDHSGGRYFAEPIRLHDTDHFSTVKPHNREHPSHILLRNFYEKKFLNILKKDNSKKDVQYPNKATKPIELASSLSSFDRENELKSIISSIKNSIREVEIFSFETICKYTRKNELYTDDVVVSHKGKKAIKKFYDRK